MNASATTAAAPTRTEPSLQCLLALAHRCANLNPEAGTIGPGMLATIVAEARAALGWFGASVLDHVPGQALQAGAVGLPVGVVEGGVGPIVVEVYALGAGIALPGQEGDLLGREGAFELEAHGVRCVVSPSLCGKAHGLVEAVERDIAAIGLQVQAVDQEELAKFGFVFDGHELAPGKTAILSLPQGMGKNVLATPLAPRIGSTAIVDGWLPGMPVLRGALHLTSAPVEGGAA